MLGVADDGDVDDGKPHRDLSHEPTEPTPVVSPSRAPPSSESFDLACPLPFIAIGREMIAWWASSALLCAIVFLLSVHAFNGKVSTYLFFAQRALKQSQMFLRAACVENNKNKSKYVSRCLC